MIHKISETMRPPRRDFIYDLLVPLHPRLCIDIGAARGGAAARMNAAVRHQQGRIVAFEPFPGNLPYLERQAAKQGNIVIKQMAVADQVGQQVFIVPQTVTGAEEGWKGFVGYSSTGMLTSAGANRTGHAIEGWLRTHLAYAKGLVAGKAPARLKVATTTLDEELRGRHVDFMKVDVQGAESQVLAGAHELLRTNSIDLMYLEWSGDPRVLEQLAKFGYHCFDSTYVCGTPKSNLPLLEQYGFTLLTEVALSTGKAAFDLVYEGRESPEAAISRVNRLRNTFIQTDLIVVANEFRSAFDAALESLDRNAS